MVNVMLREVYFSPTELTKTLSSAFEPGLNRTCNFCKNGHQPDSHSRVIAKLIAAGADGDKLRNLLVTKEISLTDHLGNIRRRHSLEELNGALTILQEKNEKEES